MQPSKFIMISIALPNLSKILSQTNQCNLTNVNTILMRIILKLMTQSALFIRRLKRFENRLNKHFWTLWFGAFLTITLMSFKIQKLKVLKLGNGSWEKNLKFKMSRLKKDKEWEMIREGIKWWG